MDDSIGGGEKTVMQRKEERQDVSMRIRGS